MRFTNFAIAAFSVSLATAMPTKRAIVFPGNNEQGEGLLPGVGKGTDTVIGTGENAIATVVKGGDNSKRAIVFPGNNEQGEGLLPGAGKTVDTVIGAAENAVATVVKANGSSDEE